MLNKYDCLCLLSSVSLDALYLFNRIFPKTTLFHPFPVIGNIPRNSPIHAFSGCIFSRVLIACWVLVTQASVSQGSCLAGDGNVQRTDTCHACEKERTEEGTLGAPRRKRQLCDFEPLATWLPEQCQVSAIKDR